MYKRELRFGALTGAAMIASLYFEYIAHLRPSYAGGVPSLVGILILIFSTVYLQQTTHKLIPYPNVKEAFLSGMVISSVAGLMFGIYSFVFVKTIDPTYVSRAIAEAVPYMQKHNKSEAFIKNFSNQMATMYSPMSQLMSGMGIVTTFGAVTSIIAASILVKRKK